jgi:hypothetical protein
LRPWRPARFSSALGLSRIARGLCATMARADGARWRRLLAFEGKTMPDGAVSNPAALWPNQGRR